MRKCMLNARILIVSAVTAILLSNLVTGVMPAQAAPASGPTLSAPNQPVLISPANGATNVAALARLSVSASDPDGDDVRVSFYGRRKTSTSASNFTLVAIPDTQFYTINTGGDYFYNAEMQWIVDHQTDQNIVFAAHMGDFVENGDEDYDESEWAIADAATKILERNAGPSDDVPFSATVGNHDDIGGTARFNHYFGLERFFGRPYYRGHYGQDNINSYSIFSAGGMNFIIIDIANTTQIPLSQALTWADSLLKDDLSRRGILVLHDMMSDATTFTSVGQAAYNALKDNPNLYLMLCGHATEGRRSDPADDGHTIYTLMSDYQGRINGGDGWLRLYEFQPANNQIQARTYSPTRNNGAGEYETDSSSQFTIPFNMRSPDFTLIDTVTVASGSTASVTWKGLTNSTAYEWYAVSRDASSVAIGSTQSFTTESAPANPPVAQNDSFTLQINSKANLLGVLANDTPGSGSSGALSVTSVSSPTHGLATFTDAAVVYTPATGYTGSDSLSYTISDGHGGSNSSTVALTISGVSISNHAPVALADSYHTPINTTLTIAAADGVLANDTDGDSDLLTAARINGPAHGTLTLNTNGSFTYTPTTGFNGTDTFTYQASDSKAGSNLAITELTVGSNHAPACAELNLNISEDSMGTISPSCTDADGDALMVALVSPPQNGSAAVIAGILVYTPPLNGFGTDTFTYRANDSAADSAPATVTVNISPANDAPDAVNDSYTVATNSSANSLAVLDNDTSAPDSGETLVVYSAGEEIAPTHGTVTHTSNAILYTPTSGFNGLDSFTYKLSDGNGGYDVATVFISVGPQCESTSGMTGCWKMDQNSGTLLLDGSGQGNNAALIGTPTWGSGVSGLAMTLNGTDQYATAPDASSLKFSSQASLSIWIQPEKYADQVLLSKATQGSVDGYELALSSTSDTGGEGKVFFRLNQATSGNTYRVNSTSTYPANGTNWMHVAATFDGSNMRIYVNCILENTMPASGVSIGTNSVKLGIGAQSNGKRFYQGTLDEARVYNRVLSSSEIQSLCGNSTPVANNDSYSTDEDTTLIIGTPGVLTNDVDTDTLTAIQVSGPAHGTLSFNNDGSFAYIPAENYYGTDSFTYYATDGKVNSATATVSLTVTAINDPPVLNSIGAKSGNELALLTFTATATDVDRPAQTLTYSLSNAPSGAAIGATSGIFTWTPTEIQGPGTYTPSVCVSDGSASDCETITITIAEVNQAPVLAAIPDQTVEAGTLLTFTATATDDDLPVQSLSFSLLLPNEGVPLGAQIDPSTGVFTWTPPADQATGVYSLDVCVSDGDLQGCQKLTILVTRNHFFHYLPILENE